MDFVEDKTEWTGTDITFDITPQGKGTQVRFRHVGLAPEVECFDTCSKAWNFYVGTSLRDLIAAGAGRPNPQEQVETG